MNSFLHFLNPHPSIHHCITLTPPIASYVHSDSPTPDNATSNNQEENSNLKSYSIIPQSDSAIEADHKLERVQTWLEALEQPAGLSDSEYKTFMQYCTEFIIISKQLWQKNPQGHHKMVVPCNRWLFLITSAHNDIGHHRVYATNALLSECYWWPDMAKDVKWFIQTCHLCQIQNLQQSLIPPCYCSPSPLILQSLHGYNVYAHIRRIQVHHSRTLLPSSLGQNGLCYKRKPEKP